MNSTEQLLCGNCDNPIEEHFNYCPNCGEKINRLTNEESIILKNLPKQFKYIARHNNLKGDLYIFTTKPYMWEDFFRSNGHQMPFNQFRHIFKGIKKGDYLDIREVENGKEM